jgi:hypothetical protein
LEIHRCDKPTGKFGAPGFLFSELGSIDAQLPRKERLEQLAALVTSPNNGRFTRTIANRLWQRLMGRGVVHPVDIMANRPWSEDLLDYLAVYLSDRDYDVKALIEHIVSSRTYQSQCAGQAEEPASEDYVFRGPEIKRMTAEQYLDTIWMVTRTAPEKPEASIALPSFAPGIAPDREFTRASLMKSDALMRSLGRPNREQVVTTRGSVLTTLQALDLANGKILYTTLAKGSAKILDERTVPTAEWLVDEIYLRALCRRPTPDEAALAHEILGKRPTQESLADLLWVVFMLPEFQLIR